MAFSQATPRLSLTGLTLAVAGIINKTLRMGGIYDAKDCSFTWAYDCFRIADTGTGNDTGTNKTQSPRHL